MAPPHFLWPDMHPRMLVAPSLLILALASCGVDTEAPPTRAEAGSASPASFNADDGVLLQALTHGDRACYVRVQRDGAAAVEEPAHFDLCERTELVGKRVRLTRERGSIHAESCSGDPECTRSDTVTLIVAAHPVDGAAAPADSQTPR
jgi:hypothetical protein